MGRAKKIADYKPEYDHLVKIILVGDKSSGKTRILHRYTDDAFSDSSGFSTIGVDFKIKTILRNEKTIKLQIWDTSGQERFKTITSAYYRGAAGILLVYSVADRMSFNSVTTWRREIEKYASDETQVLVIGHRVGDEDKTFSENDREVTSEEGERLAESQGDLFFEVDAASSYNIDAAFDGLVDLILTKGVLAPKYEKSEEKKPVSVSLENPAKKAERIKLLSTRLFAAIKRMKHPVIKEILNNRDLDINYQDKQGFTALMRAVEPQRKLFGKGARSDSMPLVRAILNRDPPPNLQAVNSKGDTVLHIAAHGAPFIEAIKEFINLDADMNQKNNEGKSLVDISYDYAKERNYHVFDILKKAFEFPQAMFFEDKQLKEVTKLSSGNFGLTFRAGLVAHTLFSGTQDLLVPVVCKVPKTESGADEWFELRLLQSLPRHSNVLNLIGMCMSFSYMSTQGIAIVILYKEGDSLRKHLDVRKHPMSLKRMCDFGIQMSRGLHHLHVHGYKHCDVAARNFLLTEIEIEEDENQIQNIVLTDFGLARPEMFEETGDRLFPWRWVSPETLKSVGKIATSKSDVWMLGVTFWELLGVKKMPFYPAKTAKLLLDLLENSNGIPQMLFPSTCPKEWKSIIDKCCCVDVTKRLPAREVQWEIKKALDQNASKSESKEAVENPMELAEGNVEEPEYVDVEYDQESPYRDTYYLAGKNEDGYQEIGDEYKATGEPSYDHAPDQQESQDFSKCTQEELMEMIKNLKQELTKEKLSKENEGEIFKKEIEKLKVENNLLKTENKTLREAKTSNNT